MDWDGEDVLGAGVPVFLWLPDTRVRAFKVGDPERTRTADLRLDRAVC